MKVQHVLIKIRNQETYFDEEAYPHYEVGWKKGEEFTLWNGNPIDANEIEAYEIL